ncbi:hypothetical protein GJV26_29055 [Massilia dura]|uniref:Uncharacterized protein n=1 Tax=Pseudoduganella dura TaxID=321982 RepID=A0A6I3XIQ2_9BURK|nr:hypothetical protein [Pseudoduganella dura]MUI16477.1 hypothetical protein [Pseudoduganella dura]GGX87095.1 hypothetical protein GCM10007386_17460 [Pseudoduganella dura]
MATVSSSEGAAVPSRTVLLWLAALLVAWLSGIEPTWRKVHDVAGRFATVNLQRQEADRQVAAAQNLVEAEKVALLELESFERAYPTPERRDAERATLYRGFVKTWDIFGGGRLAESCNPARPCQCRLPPKVAGDIREVTVHIPNLAGATSAIKRARAIAGSNLESAFDRLHNFCVAEIRLDQKTDRKQQVLRERQAEILKDGEAAYRIALADARTHAAKLVTDADVSFELLGLKFRATPLLAPVLWGGFAIAWLIAARSEAVAAWTTPAAGNEQARHRAGGVFAPLAVLAWAMLLRVAWTGIAITAYQGAMTWRALAAIALCLLLLAGAWLVTLLLSMSFTPGTAAVQPAAGAKPAIFAFLAGAGACAVAFWLPGHVLRAAHGALPIVVVIGSVPLLLATQSWLRGLPAGTAQGITGRRAVLGGAIAAGLAGIFWMVHGSTPAQANARREPRFPRRKASAPTLKRPGFYRKAEARTGAAVLHYVNGQGRSGKGGAIPRQLSASAVPPYKWLRGAKGADFPSWLVDVADPESPASERATLAGTERAALSTASWAFEQAALRLLAKDGNRQARVLPACELLLNGIRHDIAFKHRHSKLRKRSSPSFRLYDLAAGLAVRYDHPQVLQELTLRIEQAGHALLFRSRIRKWEDRGSSWHRRWRKRNVPITWHSDQTATVF